MSFGDSDKNTRNIEKRYFRINNQAIRDYTEEEATIMAEISRLWEIGDYQQALDLFEKLRIMMDNFITKCLNDLGFQQRFNRLKYFVEYRKLIENGMKNKNG